MATTFFWPERSPDQTLVPETPDPGMFKYLSTTVRDALYHSPASGVYRFAELAGADSFTGQELQPEEATKKYGIPGELQFFEPINDYAAQIMQRRKFAEIDREAMLGLGANSLGRRAAGFGTSLIATILDPINLASMFVPVVGEVKFAQMVTRFGGSLPKARLAAGAVEGLVGSAMVEPFVLLPALYEGSHYGMVDSAMNLGFGAVLGGPIHALAGSLGDDIGKFRQSEKKRVQGMVDRLNQVGDAMRVQSVVQFNDPIVASAYKLKDGRTLTGPTHASIFAEGEGLKVNSEDVEVEGWVTKSGKFITMDDIRNAPADMYQAARFREGQEPLLQRDVARSKPVISPDTQHAAMSSAVADVLNDRPVTSPGDVVKGADEITLDEAKFDAKRARDEALKELGFDTRQAPTYNQGLDMPDPKPNEPWFHGYEEEALFVKDRVAFFTREPDIAAIFTDSDVIFTTPESRNLDQVAPVFVANLDVKKTASYDRMVEVAKSLGILKSDLPKSQYPTGPDIGLMLRGELVKALKSEGYDSVAIPAEEAVAVFSPDQIKTPGRKPVKTDKGILFADGREMKRSLEKRVNDLREAKIKNLVERKKREHAKRQAEIESARKQNPVKPTELVTDDLDAEHQKVMREIEDLNPDVAETLMLTDRQKDAKVDAAAIRTMDGKIFTGTSHIEIYMREGLSIEKTAPPDKQMESDGFMLKGEYLTRPETAERLNISDAEGHQGAWSESLGVVEQVDLESMDIPPELREAIQNVKNEKTVEDAIQAGADCVIREMS